MSNLIEVIFHLKNQLWLSSIYPILGDRNCDIRAIFQPSWKYGLSLAIFLLTSTMYFLEFLLLGWTSSFSKWRGKRSGPGWKLNKYKTQCSQDLTWSSGMLTVFGLTPGFSVSKAPWRSPNHSLVDFSSSLRTSRIQSNIYSDMLWKYLHKLDAKVQAVSDMVTGGLYFKESQTSPANSNHTKSLLEFQILTCISDRFFQK